jgi:hypothetical protein
VAAEVLESDLNDLFIHNCTGAPLLVADSVNFLVGRNNNQALAGGLEGERKRQFRSCQLTLVVHFGFWTDSK